MVSMRKALDMDYELGQQLEAKRQFEIEEQFDLSTSVCQRAGDYRHDGGVD